MAPKTGKGKYAMAEYEKIKRITFPLENSHLLLITTDVKADHEKIITSILSLLKYWSLPSSKVTDLYLL